MKHFKYIFYNNSKILKNILFTNIIFFILIISSCNPTKYVPENKYLLRKNIISVDSKKIKKNNLEPYIQQKPNRTTAEIFRWHLFIYNISKHKKERKLPKWLGIYKLGEIVGEAPVLMDSSLVDKTKIQFKKYLNSKGYYNSTVFDTIIYRGKKAFVEYKIKSNIPYKYNKISYSFKDLSIRDIILADTINSLIKKNQLVDIDILNNERERITNTMRDSGYYFFGNQHIHYEIDSAFNSNTANIKFIIEKNSENITDKDVIKVAHKKYKINSTHIITDYNLQDAIYLKDSYLSSFDTISFNNLKFYFRQNYLVSPKSIARQIYINKNDNYRISRVKETYRHLSSLGTFKIVNIKFTKTEGKDNYLDCIIQLTPYSSQSYTTELEGTNSAGNLGVAGSFKYQHKSLFYGAEHFSLKLKGGIEAQTAISGENNNVIIPFNSKEVGIESSLRIPIFLLPFKVNNFVRHNAPKTIFSFAYNYQIRPDYEKTIGTGAFGYLWKSIKYFRHRFNVVEISAIKVPYKSDLFVSEVLDKNIGLKHSFENQFITATNYALVFSNQNTKKHKNYMFIRLFSESSGNILNLYNTNFNTTETKNYTIFGEQYSQYLKGDVDFRFYNILNKSNNVVYRLYGGIGVPYGNAEVLPYEKQYFSGGANGLRAWQVRSLGPGSYFNPNDVRIYQTADMKLEANFEYRFKLIWVIEGAFFADAGNIWSINKLEDREGASFNVNTFYNDIAVDGGLGMRLDFSFFILRLDYGLKFRDPKENIGNRWIITSSSYNVFNASNGMLNFSIGYPF